jgi:hypothetical protein
MKGLAPFRENTLILSNLAQIQGRSFGDGGGDHARAGASWLTGVHPKKQAQGAAMPLPSTYSNAVPEALDKLLIRALHPRVELRFASADEVLAELKQMVRLA